MIGGTEKEQENITRLNGSTCDICVVFYVYDICKTHVPDIQYCCTCITKTNHIYIKGFNQLTLAMR